MRARQGEFFSTGEVRLAGLLAESPGKHEIFDEGQTEDGKMKMRKRKIDLQARQMLGLKIEELLAELDEAADLLLEAMESEDAALGQDEKQDAGTEPVGQTGENR